MHPDTVNDMIKQAFDFRKPKAQNLQEEQWQLKVKSEWMDQLLLHDFQSSKYPRLAF